MADLDRLRVLVSDRNAPQKHVWRARIVLLTAEGVGTSAIMRETNKSKTCVWRWQERFGAEGFEGLLRDKTRPSRIPKLDPAVGDREIALVDRLQPPQAAEMSCYLADGEITSICADFLVELRGIEPLTSAVRLQRSPI